MTRNQQNDQVGDGKSPPIGPSPEGLRDGVDQACRMPAEKAGTFKALPGLRTLQLAAHSAPKEPSPGSCLQRLWLSFFLRWNRQQPGRGRGNPQAQQRRAVVQRPRA